jgi:hypothetical protein
MKTYRSEKHGFEIDIPEEWSPASGRMPMLPAAMFALKSGWAPGVEVQFLGADESVNISIEPMTPEPPPDVTELMFRLAAQDMGYANCEFGRITVGGRQHTWARYLLAGEIWSKKYMLVMDGKGYAITAACHGEPCSPGEPLFAQRERVWDAVALSFRLLAPGKHDDAVRGYSTSALRQTLEMRLERRGRNLNYGRACEAIEEDRYADARVWLEKCLDDFPDEPETRVFVLRELVRVAERLGDKKGVLGYRREIKRLRPSDWANRRELAKLLAGCGYRREAMREADELVAQEPENARFQEFRTGLLDRPVPNYRLRFMLSAVFFLLVDLDVLAGGISPRVPWLAALLCPPAAAS